MEQGFLLYYVLRTPHKRSSFCMVPQFVNLMSRLVYMLDSFGLTVTVGALHNTLITHQL